MSAIVVLVPPTFEPARTTDPIWNLSEAEIGAPFNGGTPWPQQPANQQPASLIGVTGNQQGDPYLRQIPLIKPPSNLPRGAVATRKNQLGGSRVGAGPPLTG